MEHEFEQFIVWAFYAMISGSFVIAVRILWDLKKSVESLNEKFASLIAEHTWHTREIERHEKDIQFLKQRYN